MTKLSSAVGAAALIAFSLAIGASAAKTLGITREGLHKKLRGFGIT